MATGFPIEAYVIAAKLIAIFVKTTTNRNAREVSQS
jgi:hypothetical protein